MLTANDQDGRIVISGEMQVRSAEELKKIFWDALERPGEVFLDLSGVEDVDVAGLQVLLSFLITKNSDSRAGVSSLSPALERAMRLTGTTDHFKQFLA